MIISIALCRYSQVRKMTCPCNRIIIICKILQIEDSLTPWPVVCLRNLGIEMFYRNLNIEMLQTCAFEIMSSESSICYSYLPLLVINSFWKKMRKLIKHSFISLHWEPNVSGMIKMTKSVLK